MRFDIVGSAIAAGLFWGAIVAGIHRWAGKGLPDANARSFKWFAGTAFVMALGFYALHMND
jgi:hypothetical protein